VARQVQRAGRGEVEFRPPKYGSERSVFLPPGLVETLAAHVAPHCPEGDWILAGEAGQPAHQNTVGYRWRRHRDCWRVRATAARLPALLRLGLIASGGDVVTVQRALGHASATTTLSTYSHLWPSAEDRTRAAAEGLALRTSWTGYGLEHYCRLLTGAFTPIYTLKRNVAGVFDLD
jgi:integrase